MFKDKISNDSKIFSGDTVYIYQYQKRKEIETFGDLDKVKILEVIPKGKKSDPLMVSGYIDKVIEGRHNQEKVVGIVEYIRDNDFIKTSEGDKFINYFIKDNNIKLCLRKTKEEYDYCKLFAVFKLNKNIEIKIEPYDLICYNQDNLCNLIKYTKITHPRFHNGYISFYLNNEEVYFDSFDIFINGIKYESSDNIKELFKWACDNKNSINETLYNFQKIFSLKLIGFELKKIYK